TSGGNALEYANHIVRSITNSVCHTGITLLIRCWIRLLLLRPSRVSSLMATVWITASTYIFTADSATVA
ncbi:MAG: hypothetical protein WCA89_15905, partial [Terracidiphilus sp.]